MRLHQRRTLFRLGAGAVAAAAVASVVAMSGTANAQDGGADLSVSVVGTSILQNTSKPLGITIHNNGPAPATGVTLHIDGTKLDAVGPDGSDPSGAAKLLLAPSTGCDVDANSWLITCSLPAPIPAGGTYTAWQVDDAALYLDALGDPGKAGQVTVEVTSDSDAVPANNKATADITIVPDNPEVPSGIDLLAWTNDIYGTIGGTEPIQPGQTGQFVWMLENVGPATVQGVQYTITLPRYLSFVDERPECTYEDNDRIANCHDLTAQLSQGWWYGSVNPEDPHQLEPVTVKLAGNAPGPMTLTGGVVSGAGDGSCDPNCTPPQQSSLAKRASATAVQGAAVLSPSQATQLKNAVKSSDVTADADPSDNHASFAAFSAASPTDLSVSAAAVSGHIGDTVDAKVTVSNAGPADALDTKLTLTAPAGTEFVSADKTCTATTPGKAYSCDLGTVPAHASTSETAKLKILSSTVSDGKAEVSSSVTDAKPADNVASIKVTVLADDRSPSPGPSASASPSASGTPSASTAPSTSAAPGTGGSGGGSGRLPVTGTAVGLIGVLGLGTAAVGTVLMVLARRRREGFISPID